MIKKIIVILGTVLVMPTTYAYQGLYLGGGVGAITGTVNYNGDVYSIGKNNTHYTETAVLGQLNLGYAQTFDNFFAGIELGFEFSDLDLSDITHQIQGPNSITSEIKTSLNNTYYAVIRPGFAVQDKYFFYALGGITQGDFSVTDSVSNNNDNTVEIFNNDDSVTGYRLGLGFTGPLYEHFAWRLEYSYTDYDSFDHEVSDKDGHTSQFTRDMATQQVVLGILFNGM